MLTKIERQKIRELLDRGELAALMYQVAHWAAAKESEERERNKEKLS